MSSNSGLLTSAVDRRAARTGSTLKSFAPAEIEAPPRVSPDPDLAWIELIRSGHGSGLDNLMTRHGEALHRFIYRYTNNEEDAADIAQETFVRVFKKAGRYKPTASVKTWIYTIALNLCRDRARRASRIKWVPFLGAAKNAAQGRSLEETTPAEQPDPGEFAVQRELEGAISREIAALPDNLKAPFVLCVLEGRSHTEAGEMLKLTAKSVEVRVYRARKKLRDSLHPVLQDFEIS